MTPRELDDDVVQTRLRSMSELLDDLDTVGDVTPSGLEENRLVRHAVERILSQLVDLAVAVNGHIAATVVGRAPRDYRDSFRLAAEAGAVNDELSGRLQPSVGMRNVLAHEYVDIDLELVAGAVGRARVDYGDYVMQVAGWLRSRGR